MAIKELSELGQEIFLQKYAFPGEKKYSERCKVMAKQMASVEPPEDVETIEKKFYDVLSSGDFVPGGRIIYGAGRNGGRHNLLNCYVIIPEDSVENIGQTVKDMYKISCAGGGIGFNFSKIRPKGDDIQNVKNSAPGSVSVMKMINEIGEHVRAGKNRRTALMGILDVTHPDILEFLHVKLDKGELNNFNISVAITNRFLDACENDEEWYFAYSNRKYYVYELTKTKAAYENALTKEEVLSEETEIVHIIALSEEDAVARATEHMKDNWRDEFTNPRRIVYKAKDLWNKIWKNAVESGDPGIYNKDLANSYTNVSYFEDLDSTNPCGEISLPSYGNCCLGHINLANFVLSDRTGPDVDWKRLARAVRLGIRFLDNVLTINHFPNSKCKEVGHASRRVGLGIIGLHHMLIKLGIVYGSEKCLEFIERLAATIRNVAYLKSAYLARDKGAFPEFDYKKYLSEDFARTLPARIRMLIKEHGVRNAVMLTIAPTGTTSMVHGVSSGLEPIFSAMYKRRWRVGSAWKETVVLDPLFEEYLRARKPLEPFVGAYDITPEQHMAVQAAFQEYVDSCISKTINLPEHATAEELSDMALSYARDVKGLTIYRAGSKGQEPLEAIPLTAENIKKYAAEDYDTATQSAEVCRLDGDCG